MAHFSGTHNAFLSEGGALAFVVMEVPETPHQTRDDTDFPRRLRKGEARLRLACPPLARRNGAPHERGAGGESDPPHFGADAPPEGNRWSTPRPTYSPPVRGGRSHHRDPFGKVEMLKT